VDIAAGRFGCGGDFDIYQRNHGLVRREQLNVAGENPGGISGGRAEAGEEQSSPFFLPYFYAAGIVSGGLPAAEKNRKIF
jgi:hypothetical protein